MPARTRTIVDPRWHAIFARLRRQQRLSLRDLARSVHYSKSHLHDLETGRLRPTVEAAEALDAVLQADGALAALVVDATVETTPDDDQRIAYAISHPARLDAQAVNLLADILAAQRRLDDTVPVAMMLPWAVPHWRAVQDLAASARGPHAPAIRVVAAESTQFVGWLYAEARCDADAVRMLVEAATQADAVDCGVLAAQASNFRGYVERQRGNPRGIVRHFLAAYQTPGAAPLQRVGDAAQAAHGYALLGERASALRLLGDASELATAAADTEPPSTAYWLSTTFGYLNLGLAYLGLGDRKAAADNLRAGLDGLPADQCDAEWTVEYRAALTTARAG
ncbi:hypothetical protein GCM10027280_33670 [Micromonospora polyrhachis]|uniref:Transcriptional regulator with XRE-family HTH domain n=1 Tax=Micromonospora polyrhachis TaxID=1282883 RepID=A0A7W7SS42_9ACTN|nr:helix-turn-helix transcriptional regulator [Micromonospora polyrhachis]MBB4959561.1 transcriptional regulator with XRE-family HTH domain [Micromonospora polyrhachis]